jgi:hypothetical protein
MVVCSRDTSRTCYSTERQDDEVYDVSEGEKGVARDTVQRKQDDES